MIKLPWTTESMPHFVLEVNQKCNVACETCYKRFDGTSKTFQQIQAEFETMAARLPLQAVSIAGGEPTLHPQLADIVRLVHDRGLKALLITNGVLADQQLLSTLRRAGLDMIMFHIDALQRRPDLPSNPSPADVRALRDEKVRLAAAVGLDVGISSVVNRNNLAELPSLVDYVLGHRDITYLLVTHALALGQFVQQVSTGPDGKVHLPQALPDLESVTRNRTNNGDVYDIMAAHFGLTPFAYLEAGRPRCAELRLPKGREGATGAASAEKQATEMRARQLQWINYVVPVVYKPGKAGASSYDILPLEPSAFDQALLKLYRSLSGRYIFYVRQDRVLAAVQVILAQLAAKRVFGALRVGRALVEPGRRLSAKRLAFDSGHYIGPDGDLACVEHCPNPTLRNGRVVPVCMADYAG